MYRWTYGNWSVKPKRKTRKGAPVTRGKSKPSIVPCGQSARRTERGHLWRLICDPCPCFSSHSCCGTASAQLREMQGPLVSKVRSHYPLSSTSSLPAYFGDSIPGQCPSLTFVLSLSSAHHLNASTPTLLTASPLGSLCVLTSCLTSRA